MTLVSVVPIALAVIDVGDWTFHWESATSTMPGAATTLPSSVLSTVRSVWVAYSLKDDDAVIECWAYPVSVCVVSNWSEETE